MPRKCLILGRVVSWQFFLLIQFFSELRKTLLGPVTQSLAIDRTLLTIKCPVLLVVAVALFCQKICTMMFVFQNESNEELRKNSEHA